MTAQSGRVVTLKAGDAATAMAGEDMTDLANGGVGADEVGWNFQITAASKRAVDPETAVVVKIDVPTIATTDYAVDYAHGIVSFTTQWAGGSSGSVTIGGKYLPLLTVAHATALKIKLPAPKMADATQLGDTAPRLTAIARECEIEFSHISKAAYIDDPISSFDIIYTNSGLASRPVFLEVDLSGAAVAGELLRGWFCLKSSGASHPIDGVMSKTITAYGVCQTCVGRPVTDQALFSMR